ncbi:hypothetical protein GCM10027091_53100 [Streptomyces daliensis]
MTPICAVVLMRSLQAVGGGRSGRGTAGPLTSRVTGVPAMTRLPYPTHDGPPGGGVRVGGEDPYGWRVTGALARRPRGGALVRGADGWLPQPEFSGNGEFR